MLIPAACRDLDLDLVSRTLEKHYGALCPAARELEVSLIDLRRLVRSKPRLLDLGHELMQTVIEAAAGELIRAMFSDDPRRREWASDRLMSSWAARNHPLAPARKHVEVNVSVQPQARLEVKWGDRTHIATIPRPLEIEHDDSERVVEDKPGVIEPT
jgi:hypothetical protein